MFKNSFIIAFFIYLSSTEFAPHFLQLIVLPLLFFKNKKEFKLTGNYKIILFLVYCCIINEIIGIVFFSYHTIISYFDIVPYFIFIIFTIILSRNITISIVKWILLFICIEIILGLIQYQLGVKSFTNSTDLLNDGILMNQRVHGLSGNSSGLAQKTFFALLLFVAFLDKIRFNKYIFFSIILIGSIITFNRTFIFSSFIFIVLSYRYKIKMFVSSRFKRLLIYSGLFGVIVLLISSFNDVLITQLLRGRTEITDSMSALSERDLLYKYFFDFIKQNPFLGNNSFKLNYTTVDGRVIHAHNSYLQLFANNGIFIGSIFLTFIIKLINRDNYIYVLPILLSGVLQYSIFWGTSFADLFFYFFIFSKYKYGRVSEINHPILI